jgi:thioredoxin
MNKSIFSTKVQSHTNPLIVDFWAPWCTPCKITKPILQKLAQVYQGKVGFWEINADQNPDLLRELGVLGIPTLVVFRDGKEIMRQVGSKPANQYAEMFRQLAEGKPPSAQVAPIDRFLRIGAGLAIFAIGLGYANWLLAAAGGLLAFTGVYDRCPIWKAVTGWIRQRMVNPK